MNHAELHKKLIAAARAQAPDDRVPYAFEKRVMAHLAARAAGDQWGLWTRGLWRAAFSCAIVAILLGVLSMFLIKPTNPGNDLSQDFENTLLATIDQGEPMP